MGLFSSSSETTTRTRTEQSQTTKVKGTAKATSSSVAKSSGDIDLKKLVAQAEATGFNPLTILRNGGLGLYGRQTATTNNKSSETQTSEQTVDGKSYTWQKSETKDKPSIMGAIGQILDVGSGIIGLGKSIAPAMASLPQMSAGGYADAAYGAAGIPNPASGGSAAAFSAPVSQALMNAQLRGTQAGKPMSRSFYTPSTVSAGGKTALGGGAGATIAPEPYEPTWSNPFYHGSGGVVDPSIPDVETGAEARYGDIVAAPFGLWNLYGDAMYNLTGKTAAERGTPETNVVDQWSGQDMGPQGAVLAGAVANGFANLARGFNNVIGSDAAVGTGWVPPTARPTPAQIYIQGASGGSPTFDSWSW